MKSLPLKKPSKSQREKQVLIGLVELYLKHGKPVGSNTLRDNGFEELSPATIRNYFAKLEAEGFLKQQHSSGGRIPTNEAYRFYADALVYHSKDDLAPNVSIKELFLQETREVSAYLQRCAELLSEKTQTAVFLSMPRFDQDFILDVKIVNIDHTRCLCVLITDFGMIKTETLFTPRKLSSFTLKRIEEYFEAKIHGRQKPTLSKDEEALASKFYNEVMLRHIVSYNNYFSVDIIKTGFSTLLSYPDFTEDATGLASGLAFFENSDALKSMLSKSCESGSFCCWIGEELSHLSPSPSHSCAVLSYPYKINQTAAGAVGILGPSRMPYKELLAVMKGACDAISESLTKSLYKFKISFRKPQGPYFASEEIPASVKEKAHSLLLEDKTHKE